MISLIMPTLNRIAETVVFLESLAVQTFRNFELIVVDQNTDNRLEGIIKKYSTQYKIQYLKSNNKGLSRNRNIGMALAQGAIIGFPDDDCEYKPDTLEFVYNFFFASHYDFLSFNFEDKERGKTALKRNAKKIYYSRIYGSGISFTIFARKPCLNNFKFDERLGVGAKFGSGEEGDLILFMIRSGYKGYYNGLYTVYHPIKDDIFDIERNYSYALGFGALHKKAVYVYHYYYFFFRFLCYILKNIFAFIFTKHKKYYLFGIKGKLQGFLKYKQEKYERIKTYDIYAKIL